MSRLNDKHILPIKLLVYNHDTGEILSPIVTANYTVATPLRKFLLEILPQLHGVSGGIEFLTNVDERFVERIDTENPHHPYYHVLAVLYSPQKTRPSVEYPDREAFLAALSKGETREKLYRFLNINPLKVDKLLELSNQIVKVKAFSLPTKLVHALKGILFLRQESEGISLAYYTGDRILYERFQLQGETATKLAENSVFRIYRDIASRKDLFDFHIIRRVLVRDNLLFVDHFNGNSRELKTFVREQEKDAGEAYRDTGNRVLAMNLLDEKRARLDFGFLIRELDLESGFRYMTDYLASAHQQLVAVHEVGVNEWYLLTRDEQHRDYRIYHSHTSQRRLQEPLATFTLPDVPRAFLWMQQLEVGLVASSTHLYLLEPASPDPFPQKLDELLRTSHERFEVSGEVQDLKAIRIGEQEAVAIVQDQRILLTIFEEYL